MIYYYSPLRGLLRSTDSERHRITIFSKIIYNILVLTLIALAGCGESDWRNRPVPPFQPGEVVGEGRPTPPEVEIVQPAGERIASKPGQPIEYLVRLSYPGGGILPSKMRVVFRDARGGDAGSYSLEPKQRNGFAFTFGSRLISPRRAGKYRLIIEADCLVDDGMVKGVHSPSPIFPNVSLASQMVEVQR